MAKKKLYEYGGIKYKLCVECDNLIQETANTCEHCGA